MCLIIEYFKTPIDFIFLKVSRNNFKKEYKEIMSKDISYEAIFFVIYMVVMFTLYSSIMIYIVGDKNGVLF